jgi:hypothetical protein
VSTTRTRLAPRLAAVIALVALTAGVAGVAQADPTFSFAAVSFSNASPGPVIAVTAAQDVRIDCRFAKHGESLPAYTIGCERNWKPVLPDDGTYDFDLRSTDSDNATLSLGSSVTIDRTAPLVVISGGPAEGAVLTTDSATVTFAAEDTYMQATDCAVDGGAFATCTSSVSASGLADGSHALRIRARDRAGNETNVVRTFTVNVNGTATPTPVETATPTPTPPPTIITIGDKQSPDGTVGGTSQPAAAIKAKLALKVTRTRAWTKLRSITLSGLPAGAAVKATCHGKGCPPKALRLTATRTTLSLSGLKNSKLKPGATITIAISKPGMTAQKLTVKIRATRSPQVR